MNERVLLQKRDIFLDRHPRIRKLLHGKRVHNGVVRHRYARFEELVKGGRGGVGVAAVPVIFEEEVEEGRRKSGREGREEVAAASGGEERRDEGNDALVVDHDDLASLQQLLTAEQTSESVNRSPTAVAARGRSGWRDQYEAR